MNKQTLAQTLTYAGLLPFWGAAIIPAIVPDLLGLDYDRIILTYGAVIASFIAGIHWGVYLFKNTHINLFIHSNIAALLAWFAVIAALPGSEAVLIGCFLYLLFIDKQLKNANIIEPWYLRMRIIATTAVVIILSFTLLYP